jgi:hypothetical protein
MRNDAVYQYVDMMDHVTYNVATFPLPMSAPANPEHESGVMIAPRKKEKTVFRDDEDDVDEDDEESEDYFATSPKRNKPAARK